MRFFDAFNSDKGEETLGIVMGVTPGSETWHRVKTVVYRVLLRDGRIMDAYDYELREIQSGRAGLDGVEQ